MIGEEKGTIGKEMGEVEGGEYYTRTIVEVRVHTLTSVQPLGSE